MIYEKTETYIIKEHHKRKMLRTELIIAIKNYLKENKNVKFVNVDKQRREVLLEYYNNNILNKEIFKNPIKLIDMTLTYDKNNNLNTV